LRKREDTQVSSVFIFTVSVLKNGDCRVTRSTVSGDVSIPMIFRRAELEDYFRGTALVRGTLEDAWKDLDRVGIVEFSAIE
jgi:hypothetical protein